MEVGCCLQLLWLRVLLRKRFNSTIVDDFSCDELNSSEEEEEEEDDDEEEGTQQPEEAEDEEEEGTQQPQEAEEEEDDDTQSLADSPSPFPCKTVRNPYYDELFKMYPLRSGGPTMLKTECLQIQELRIAVGTWNAAGRTPPPHVDLTDWLESSGPADIYVIGFQEIVPLNVNNVCGLDDTEPAARWQALICDALNKPGIGGDWNKETLTSSSPFGQGDVCNHQIIGNGAITDELLVKPLLSPASPTFSGLGKKQDWYVRVVSKQMVGIHISIWMRKKFCRFIRRMSVSCVGLGLMGCLGNKGAVSVSMMIHQTSFCFTCAHLTSGDREGDEKRRNWDAMEILKRTYFPLSKEVQVENLRTIGGHDRIIWLGDLNYRLDLIDSEIRILVANQDWASLLREDQLRKQSQTGQVFEGWNEGTISFSPTYKYEFGSIRYAGENLKHGEKQRSPAWCDRVIWHGKGLELLTYTCGESMFSDHRPVMAVFSSTIELLLQCKRQKPMTSRAC